MTIGMTLDNLSFSFIRVLNTMELIKDNKNPLIQGFMIQKVMVILLNISIYNLRFTAAKRMVNHDEYQYLHNLETVMMKVVIMKVGMAWLHMFGTKMILDLQTFSFINNEKMGRQNYFTNYYGLLKVPRIPRFLNSKNVHI